MAPRCQPLHRHWPSLEAKDFESVPSFKDSEAAPSFRRSDDKQHLYPKPSREDPPSSRCLEGRRIGMIILIIDFPEHCSSNFDCLSDRRSTLKCLIPHCYLAHHAIPRYEGSSQTVLIGLRIDLCHISSVVTSSFGRLVPIDDVP